MHERPLLLGHRGLRVPQGPAENTLAAFDLALKHGCDGFEFDVRLAGNGRAVICHDARVDGIVVADASGTQLGDLPQLEQVLSTYAGRAFLDIELKVKGLEDRLLAGLGTHPPQRGLVVSSFLPQVLEQMRAQDSQVPLGIICHMREELGRWTELPLQWVIPHHSLVNQALVRQVHDAGKKLMVWTVNQPRQMERLAEWGADAMVSDDPDLLVKTLRGTKR
jgi:glycerophosphoryl diester phosphodiesterase